MHKYYASILFLVLFSISSNLSAADVNKSLNKKEDILKEDEIDPTDIFAIPLDDSEVEDEEEYARMEAKSKRFEQKQAAEAQKK